ncbi:MAG: hypothetical protein ACK5Z2_03060 [Bacteroidota bacterium]|jgi:hypothetical protein
MQLMAVIGSVAVLTGIAVQDVRHRAFVWWLLPLLLAALLVLSLQQVTFQELWPSLLINFGFIGIQLLLLFLWFSLRERKWIKLIDTHIGLGDILLLTCLAAAFSPANFILFVVGGLIFSLCIVLVYRSINRKASPLIPLAALLAVPMALCVAAVPLFDINLHNDSWMLSLTESAY